MAKGDECVNDPTGWPFLVRLEEVVCFDRHGQPIRNSAGEDVNPPARVEVNFVFIPTSAGDYSLDQ